jgi:putative endopeptidase
MLRTSLIGALLAVISFTALAVGIERDAMDTSTAPGDDFWTYANGAWVKGHPIPADRSSYGVDAVLTEKTKKRTVDLIQAAAHNAEPGSDAQKVGDYYASFMDEAGIEAKGITPLQPMFAKIAAIGDRMALARYLGQGLRADVDILNATDLYTDNLFGLWVSPSFQDPLAALCPAGEARGKLKFRRPHHRLLAGAIALAPRSTERVLPTLAHPFIQIARG